ncbi:site-specific integrase [Acidobacteria bacterium AH-259-D05]|nr:site-specific integrase [Acidobacteria bacterium AH-259-D05]
MAEDDIYGSKAKYERFKDNLKLQLVPPDKRPHTKGTQGKYYCRNPENLKYFRKLFTHFEARDLSYIGRHRMLQTMRLICYLTSKDLADCTRDDINLIMASMHKVYQTPKSKQTFISNFKYIFRILFPEMDEKERPDETIVPYVVRHLSTKVDKSAHKLRKDKLTWEELEHLVNYFSNDVRIQAYLTLALESLARPQELLYIRIKDIELHDNYAKLFITEHGKEGPGLLQCIDSYPYLLKWLEVHPLKKDKDAFLFINTGNTNRCKQLKPSNINKLIRIACKDLQIDKPITCYSLKRNGVTIRRLRGDTDMEIQHAARWTSTKQLKTYDLSNQDDAFKKELEKRGLLPSTKDTKPKIQTCVYCNKTAGFGETLCRQCKRPLDRHAIRTEQLEKDKEINQLKQELKNIKDQIELLKQQSIPGLMLDLLALKKNEVATSGMINQN